MLGEDAKEIEEKLEIFIPNGPRLGNEVIEAIDISKAFGDKLLYENLSFKLPPAGIVLLCDSATITKAEMYMLKSGGERVLILAKDIRGFVNAAQTLLQLFPLKKQSTRRAR